MKKSTTRLAVAVVVAAALIMVAVWIAIDVHWVEERREIGFQGEARRNPLLACERLFDELGLPAESRPYLGVLPPLDQVLILRSTGRFLAPTTVARLFEWVDGGGNLLWLFPSDDDLMELLEDDLEAGRFELPVARELELSCILDETPDRDATLDLGQEPLEIELDSRLAFEDSGGLADLRVGEAMRAHLLSFERGLGRITIVADDAWATNEHIDEPDHASALWQLAQLEGPRSGAVIVFGEKPPGFLAMLFEHGWQVIASLAALVALHLWRIGSRFGPRLVDPPRGRRDFSEHVVASSEFLWRQQAWSKLLAAPRHELRRRLGLRRPHLARASTEPGFAEAAAELARLSELPHERVERALELRATGDAEEFTEVVRDLATLRKAL